MTMNAPADLWYVKHGDDEPIGPVTTELLMKGLRARRVPISARVCQVGGENWTDLAAHEAFARVIREVAPPPPGPPPGSAVPTLPATVENAPRVARPANEPQRSALWYVVVVFGSVTGSVVLLVLLAAIVSAVVAAKAQMEHQRELERQLNTLNSDKEDLDRKLKTATTPEERASIEQQIADKEAAMHALKNNGTTPPIVHPTTTAMATTTTTATNKQSFATACIAYAKSACAKAATCDGYEGALVVAGKSTCVREETAMCTMSKNTDPAFWSKCAEQIRPWSCRTWNESPALGESKCSHEADGSASTTPKARITRPPCNCVPGDPECACP
jgi:hypothetical protein